MAGLVLSLRPYEKVLIGGVVVQNGGKKAAIRVLDDAAGVLRLSDAMHPDDARTPLTRCYYAAQLLLTGQAGQGGETALAALLTDARDAFKGFAFAPDLKVASDAARANAWFRVMRTLRPMLPQEAALLSDPRFRPAPPAPDLPAAVIAGVEREALTTQ